MKFMIYNPLLPHIPERDRPLFAGWQDVDGLVGMLKAIYPAGPYIIHDSGPTEKTMCVVDGHKFFVRPVKFAYKYQGLLVDLYPDGSEGLRGYVRLEYAESLPSQTASWNMDKETWDVRNGLPHAKGCK